jgi:hypothetical protein
VQNVEHIESAAFVLVLIISAVDAFRGGHHVHFKVTSVMVKDNMIWIMKITHNVSSESSGH